MLTAAILVVGPNFWVSDCFSRLPESPECLAGAPLASIEVLGQSVLQRTIMQLQRDGVSDISVMADDSLSVLVPRLPTRRIEVGLVHRPVDVWFAADRKFGEYIEKGAEVVVLMRLGAYAEFDLSELLQFHREHGQPVTRVYDGAGPLDFWILSARHDSSNSSNHCAGARITDASTVVPCPLSGYVNRLASARDLRRLVVDCFLSRATFRPGGRQVKAGVWLDDGAQVHRRTRIVAPAYIGRGVKVEADALITRCSSLERGCDVGYGTVVEDASILADTYLGTGLDVCHAIVCGRNLIHFRHDVSVEINDPRLLGESGLIRPRPSYTGEPSVPAMMPDGPRESSQTLQPAFLPSKLNAWAG